MKRILIITMLIISVGIFAMTDMEMQNIMMASEKWEAFEPGFNSYVENQGIQNWDFHDQVTAYLQDDIGIMSEAEAWEWWFDDHDFYTETSVEWVYPWGLWYMKFKEWYNGTQWT